MGRYHWSTENCAEGYEALLRPDESEVTCLTEPEDRTSYRDLSDVTAELNRLLADKDTLAKRVEELEDMLAPWGLLVAQRVERLTLGGVDREHDREEDRAMDAVRAEAVEIAAKRRETSENNTTKRGCATSALRSSALREALRGAHDWMLDYGCDCGVGEEGSCALCVVERVLEVTP